MTSHTLSYLSCDGADCGTEYPGEGRIELLPRKLRDLAIEAGWSSTNTGRGGITDLCTACTTRVAELERAIAAITQGRRHEVTRADG